MLRRSLALVMLVTTVLVLGTIGSTYFAAHESGASLTQAGQAFVESLDEQQRKVAIMESGSPAQVKWHFIPMDERKGLELNAMSEKQRELAHGLIKAALSEMGYSKASQIMNLERVLNEFEGGKGRWKRDSLRYYVTLFGMPTSDHEWGLSFEGHHLSMNFVVSNNHLVSTTPQFFASNPAIVKNENQVGVPVGTRVLAKEETLAFDLVNSLSPEQKADAIIAEEAPAEIRDAGSAQPPAHESVGIPYAKLNTQQKGMLLSLMETYARAVPDQIANQRLNQLQFDGLDAIRFAWAGATEPGIGHYYRIEAPSFLIEFVNTQPDAKGNPANHIHCVWRDMHGDFNIPIED